VGIILSDYLTNSQLSSTLMEVKHAFYSVKVNQKSKFGEGRSNGFEKSIKQARSFLDDPARHIGGFNLFFIFYKSRRDADTQQYAPIIRKCKIAGHIRTNHWGSHGVPADIVPIYSVRRRRRNECRDIRI